jgi:hypothetical protein
MRLKRLCFLPFCTIHTQAAIGIGTGSAAQMSVIQAEGENKDPTAPGWAKHVFFVRLEGVIEKGDGEKFQRLVSRLPLLMAIVILNSPGGNLQSGIEIGREIDVRGYSAAVQSEKICASACALAWLAGDKRFMEPTSQIGFHAASVALRLKLFPTLVEAHGNSSNYI